MNNNFNANELIIIYGIINEMKEAFRQLEYAGRCASQSYPYPIYSLVSSEDSRLAGAWRNSCDIASSISSKADGLLTNMNEEFENYIRSTIENEETTASAVLNINNALKERKAALDQIEI